LGGGESMLDLSIRPPASKKFPHVALPREVIATIFLDTLSKMCFHRERA